MRLTKPDCIGSETPNLSCSKTASFLYGSASSTYMLMNFRCGGAVAGCPTQIFPLSAQTPILLDKNHPLTSLKVMDAHRHVMHNGVKETLTELRSSYWLVRGRQFVHKVIHRCLTCRKLEGRPFQSVPSPPLPEYRVRQSRPFCYTGVDFAGPLYVKQSVISKRGKVWLCLYTCCVTRAVLPI